MLSITFNTQYTLGILTCQSSGMYYFNKNMIYSSTCVHTNVVSIKSTQFSSFNLGIFAYYSLHTIVWYVYFTKKRFIFLKWNKINTFPPGFRVWSVNDYIWVSLWLACFLLRIHPKFFSIKGSKLFLLHTVSCHGVPFLLL